MLGSNDFFREIAKRYMPQPGQQQGSAGPGTYGRFFQENAPTQGVNAGGAAGSGYNQAFGGTGTWQDGMGQMRHGFASLGGFGIGQTDPWAGQRFYSDPRKAELGGR